MVRFFCTCLLAYFMPSVAMAQSSNGSCRVSAEKVEQIDTRFMGMEYQLIAFSLAEKYCGAKPKPMKERFLGYVEEKGCGPETEIYSEINTAIDKIEGASLASLAQDVLGEAALSKQQVDEWLVETVGALGGCGALKKIHDAEN